jgi:hypothetical protein
MKFHLLLSIVLISSLLLTSCSNQKNINAADLTAYESSCQELVTTVSDLTQVVHTNLLAMTHPFQPVTIGLMGEDVPPPPVQTEARNPLDSLPKERADVVMSSFTKINANLNTLHTKSATLMERIQQIQKDMATLRTELEKEEQSQEAKTLFAGIPDRIEKTKAEITAFDEEVEAAQAKNLEFLGSEEVLKPGLSYLIAYSSKI